MSTNPRSQVKHVGLVDIPKLGDQSYACLLLRLDELAVEERDQRFAFSRPQRVVSQFHDGATASGG